MIATPPDQHTGSSLAAPIQGSDTTRFGKHMQKTNARFLLDTGSGKNSNGGQSTKARMASPGALRPM
jgi:hypothetical protein